jgi:hypothetical protein
MSNMTEKEEDFSESLVGLDPFFTISLLMNTNSFKEFTDKLQITEVNKLIVDDPDSQFYIVLALGFMYENPKVTPIFYEFIKSDSTISFSKDAFSEGIDMVTKKLLGLQDRNNSIQSGGANIVEYVKIIGQLIIIFAINYYYMSVYHKDITNISKFGEQVVGVWAGLKNGCQSEGTSSSLQRILRSGTSNPAAIDAFFNIRECILNPQVRDIATENYFAFFSKQSEGNLKTQLFQKIDGLKAAGLLEGPSSMSTSLTTIDVGSSNALVLYNNEMKAVVPYLESYLKFEKGSEQDFKTNIVSLSKMTPEQLRVFLNPKTPTSAPTPTAFPSSTVPSSIVPTPPPFVSDLLSVASQAVNYWNPSSNMVDSFYYALADMFKEANRGLEDSITTGKRKTEDLFTAAERIYRNIMNLLNILQILLPLNSYALALIIRLYFKLRGTKPQETSTLATITNGSSEPDEGNNSTVNTEGKDPKKAFRGGLRKTRKINKRRKLNKSRRGMKTHKKRKNMRRRKSLRR